MVISSQDVDDEESITLVCIYFNHLLRAIGVNQSYDADQVTCPGILANSGLRRRFRY
jgi:hypothetical protein